VNGIIDRIFGMGLSTKAALFRQMATLIQAGIPMLGCLEALGRTGDSRVRQVLDYTTRIVRDGSPLSDGLGHFPQYFEAYMVQLVRAGEVGGSLDTHLNALADYLERMNRLRMELISKLVYPVLVLHGAIFIPPIFILVLQGPVPYLRATLIPLFSIYASLLFSHVAYRLLGIIPGFLMLVDTILVVIPFINRYFKARSSYRFLMVLGQLIDAGVGVELSIETAADACGNLAVGYHLKSTIREIQDGQTLTGAFRKTGVFPETSLQMVHTGEQAGRLPFMLKKAAELQEMNLTQTLTRIMTVASVLLYLTVAAFVGFIVITFFVHFYSSIVPPL
jgi:type II secretory pathway component PulF